uniref:DUF6533 domain-containing protein n=1 Tax=Moniliophthora roreri TaxID=221103 RepID=A0A0W0G9Q8_MONRR
MGDLPTDKGGWQGIVYEHHIHEITQVVAVSFLYWDHLITLGDEVKHVWAHPKSRSSFLFLFLRYFGLTSNTSVLILAKSPLSHDLQSLQSLSTDPPHFIPNLFSATVLLTLRIYALFNCDKRILVFLCGSAVIFLGMAAYFLVGQEKVRYPIEIGCHIGISHQTALGLSGVWTALFAYDAILFLLTTSRTYRYWLRSRFEFGTERLTLVSLMFRDGAIYFFVMAMATLSNILTFHLSGPFMRGGLSSFASCVSVTLMCRLMLNLHASADTGIYTKPGDPHRPENAESSDNGTGPTVSSEVILETMITDDILMSTFSTTYRPEAGGVVR